MNKEPIGLYIFRFVLGFGLFAFMCMLYWSSTLIEDRLVVIRTDISQLKNDLFSLHTDMANMRSEILQSFASEQGQLKSLALCCATSASKAADLVLPASSKQDESPSKKTNNSNKYANILLPDPFYKNVLPKLLGKDFIPQGVQHVASVGKPQNLHPFSNWRQVSTWRDLCNVSVARSQFGKYETFAPDMGLKMEERINPKTGIPEYWVYLRDDVYWQPLKQEFFSSGIRLAPQFLRKNQVTSEDFKFYYDVMMNPYVQEPGAVALRTYYNDLQELEVIDKFTFVVRWKANEKGKIKYIAKQMTGGLKPLAAFVYKYFSDGKKIIADDAAPDTYRTNSVWAQNFSEL